LYLHLRVKRLFLRSFHPHPTVWMRIKERNVPHLSIEMRGKRQTMPLPSSLHESSPPRHH
jgi:hypothetical protein